MKEYLIKAIYSCFDDFSTAPEISDITRAINAEHTLGKYHALLGVLKQIDIDLFCETVERTRKQATELLEIVNSLYDIDATSSILLRCLDEVEELRQIYAEKCLDDYDFRVAAANIAALHPIDEFKSRAYWTDKLKDNTKSKYHNRYFNDRFHI